MNNPNIVTINLRNDTKQKIELSLEKDSSKFCTIQPNKIDFITTNLRILNNCFITESETYKCYFYLLNPSSVYSYRGNGVLWNETLNQNTVSQNQQTNPGYITIKALDSSIECAISGFNGAYYRVNELQFVNFARQEGQYILRMYDNNRNIRRFKVNSGKGYYVINSEKCIDMDTNSYLPLYDGEDEIEREAKNYEIYDRERNLLLQSTPTK